MHLCENDELRVTMNINYSLSEIKLLNSLIAIWCQSEEQDGEYCTNISKMLSEGIRQDSSRGDNITWRFGSVNNSQENSIVQTVSHSGNLMVSQAICGQCLTKGIEAWQRYFSK